MRIKESLVRLASRKQLFSWGLYLVVFVFVVAGVSWQLASHAATPALSAEAEDGMLNGAAAKVGDPSASGSSAVRFGSASAPAGNYSEASPPWQLQPGESVDDNRPAGVAVVNYGDYSNNDARSFGQTLAAIRLAAKAPYYVRMPAGTFHITDFSFAAGTGTGRGYQDVNSTKYFGGLIGAGADKTFIVMDANAMTQAQLSGVSAGNPSPIQVSAIHAGGTNLSIPTFFSGITFRGNFQQTVALSGLGGTSPAPYAGLDLVSAKPGSMVEYCRFQGFGFAAKQSPPYEMSALGSIHSSYTVRRTEIDGRLAKEINAAQPVASGGFMWNYENSVKVIDSWLHDTRRSGWAMHDHATSEGGNANDPGVYYSDNFQVDNISNTTDSFAGSLPLGFADSNVEELRQSFTYVSPHFTSNRSDHAHISIATSNGNTMANSITVTNPIIGNSEYNGCLVVRFVKTPNSGGSSPYYTMYQSKGLGALPIKVSNKGKVLTPVLSADFNAATTTPDKNYVVIMN